MLELGQFFLVHVRSAVLWERARLRVYDLCATRTGMPSFRKMLVILWFSRSEMYQWNLEVRPFCVGRSRVSLMAL